LITKHEHGAGPASNDGALATRAFFEQIHNTGLLRSAAVASDVATAVLSTLLLTVSREHAREFLSSLPPTLRELLHGGGFERRQEPEIAEREQMLRTIADRLWIEPEGAERAVRIVLAAAQNWLPRKELELLRRRLPRGLGDLWVPPETARRL
jgi:uncharacterized protein (DUF2267 family)